MRALSQDEREKLLIHLLIQGQGGLDPQSEPENEDLWCICRVCRRMPDERENVSLCCRKRTCVTSYVMFNNINFFWTGEF